MEKLKNEEYQQIIQNVKEVLKGFSSNYRQKLVYKLLNAVKSNDQKEFFWIVLRVLNTKSDDPNVEKLSERIRKMYPLSSSEFERVAYSIILGIMSAGGGESG